MNQKNLVSVALVAAVMLTISSCASGRHYTAKAPTTLPYVSLIITPSAGFIMNHDPDGRYYHRSQQGFVYWKGYKDHFYLDKEYLKQVNYNKREYNEWKRWYEKRDKYKRHRYSY
jgi:hypothetical protein